MKTMPQPSFNLPEPQSANKAQQASAQPQELSAGEKVAQRLAAKQFFFQSLGLDWQPDDDDVAKEHLMLPEDGSIVRLPDFEYKAREPESSATSLFNFTPTEETEPELTEEEWDLIKSQRQASKAKQSEMNQAGNLFGKPPSPVPPLSPLQPQPQAPGGVIPPVEGPGSA